MTIQSARSSGTRGPNFVRHWSSADCAGRSRRFWKPGRGPRHRCRAPRNLGRRASRIMAGGQPRFANQVAWARFYLAKAGYIDASTRGVWTLTERGRSHSGMTHAEAVTLFREVHSQFSTTSAGDRESDIVEEDTSAPDTGGPSTDGDYRSRFSVICLRSFRQLALSGSAQRMLRESGFEAGDVTGRSGDGGIDGIGITSRSVRW